jgi:hypothetical protein
MRRYSGAVSTRFLATKSYGSDFCGASRSATVAGAFE